MRNRLSERKERRIHQQGQSTVIETSSSAEDNCQQAELREQSEARSILPYIKCVYCYTSNPTEFISDMTLATALAQALDPRLAALSCPYLSPKDRTLEIVWLADSNREWF